MELPTPCGTGGDTGHPSAVAAMSAQDDAATTPLEKHYFNVGEEAVDITGVESRRAAMSEVDGSVNK